MPASKRFRAFTLIEMMIAMLLGMLVVAAVVSVFLSSGQSFKTNAALAGVESGSRTAFEIMTSDIRQASLAGCDTSSGLVSNTLNDQANWWANWANSLHGYTGAQADPAVVTGGGVGQRVAGTDSLQIMHADGEVAAVTSDSEPSATIQIEPYLEALYVGAPVVACSMDHAVIFQVTGYTGSGASGTVTHAIGSAYPGNCSTGLGYPTSCDGGAGAIYTLPDSSTLSPLDADDWYIGNNPVGGTSLYRVALVSDGASGVTVQDQEIVRGVTALDFSYLLSGTQNFVDATGVANWGAVVAVKMDLTLESVDQTASITGTPLTRSYSVVVFLRNHSF